MRTSHFLSEGEGNCVGTGHVVNTQTLYSSYYRSGGYHIISHTRSPYQECTHKQVQQCLLPKYAWALITLSLFPISCGFDKLSKSHVAQTRDEAIVLFFDQLCHSPMLQIMSDYALAISRLFSDYALDIAHLSIASAWQREAHKSSVFYF